MDEDDNGKLMLQMVVKHLLFFLGSEKVYLPSMLYVYSLQVLILSQKPVTAHFTVSSYCVMTFHGRVLMILP